jgi:hypothetical protein
VDPDLLVNQIISRDFKATYILPRDIYEIFDRCTQLDPDARPTAAELLELPAMQEASPVVLRAARMSDGKILSSRASIAQKHIAIAGKSSMTHGMNHQVNTRISSSLSSPIPTFGGDGLFPKMHSWV